jgi:hypothetical protein
MTDEIKLQSGRSIYLRELHQYGVYEGLLNGLPTRERNEKFVTRLLKEEVSQTYQSTPYLIPPVEQIIEMPEGNTYPFGTPAALPSVVCICRFESLLPKASTQGDASGMVVIWFQENFHYPPEREIVMQIQQIDWESHAGNFEY